MKFEEKQKVELIFTFYICFNMRGWVSSVIHDILMWPRPYRGCLDLRPMVQQPKQLPRLKRNENNFSGGQICMFMKNLSACAQNSICSFYLTYIYTLTLLTKRYFTQDFTPHPMVWLVIIMMAQVAEVVVQDSSWLQFHCIYMFVCLLFFLLSTTQVSVPGSNLWRTTHTSHSFHTQSPTKQICY